MTMVLPRPQPLPAGSEPEGVGIPAELMAEIDVRVLDIALDICDSMRAAVGLPREALIQAVYRAVLGAYDQAVASQGEVESKELTGQAVHSFHDWSYSASVS